MIYCSLISWKHCGNMGYPGKAYESFGRKCAPSGTGHDSNSGAHTGVMAKVFAVGDPNQVIYSWRGTGENMFFLLKHRLGAKELTLPVNYRSNGAILEAANRFPAVWKPDRGQPENGGADCSEEPL